MIMRACAKSEIMATDPLPYTQLASTNRRVLAELVPLPMPLSLHIEPTNVCNFRCVSCPQSLPNFKQTAGYYQRMDLGLYEKILRDVRDMGRLKALKLFGYGEPMLHPDLGRMVSMAHDMEVTDRIEFTSNVACLDEKMARALIGTARLSAGVHLCARPGDARAVHAVAIQRRTDLREPAAPAIASRPKRRQEALHLFENVRLCDARGSRAISPKVSGYRRRDRV